MKALTIAVLIMAVGSAGCAPKPEDVAAAYVSPSKYADLSCKQIINQRNAVVEQVNQLNGAQAKQAENDSATTAVGMILFWPALFFVGHNDSSPQLAAAKGDYDALTAAGEAKKCF